MTHVCGFVRDAAQTQTHTHGTEVVDVAGGSERRHVPPSRPHGTQLPATEERTIRIGGGKLG